VGILAPRQIGLYFVFIGHYTSWLLGPGMIVSVVWLLVCLAPLVVAQDGACVRVRTPGPDPVHRAADHAEWVSS
jgi:hypothetical protein